MANDVQDLAQALIEIKQNDAAERLLTRNEMPIEIACSETCLANYSSKLSMYTAVKSNWLIRDESILFNYSRSEKKAS